MNKIFTIIAREYITRVRKISFIVITLVVPILMGALMVLPIAIAKLSSGIDQYVIVDDSNTFTGKFNNTNKIKYTFLDIDIDSAKETYKDQGYKGILYIPTLNIDRPLGITYFSDSQIGLSASMHMKRELEREIENIRYKTEGIDRELITKLRAKIDLNVILLSEEGEKEGNTAVAAGLSYVMGFMLYFILLMYGTMIMKGVVEEKKNRIVEVMISSVKPFQLMIGKIIGIAAVALTQIIIWMVLLGGIYFALYVTFLPEIADVALDSAQTQMARSNMPEVISIMASLETINFPKVLTTFILFFTFGYLLYSAMFAALGSVMGEDTENNSASILVVAPIIIAFMTMLHVIEQPSSPFAFWMSMIPLFSPIVMVARVPFDVPTWQLALSFLLLVGTFVFATWLSGRIYRVGILLYGKKITFKEIIKWMFRKEAS